MLITFSLQGPSAINVVECENERGEKSFRKSCPPGTIQITIKKINIGKSSRENNNSTIKATLYFIPDCDTCDQVREFLDMNGISFDEKNVRERIEIQEELNRISGGLVIPTTVIGTEIIVGYQRSKFKEVLAKAKDGDIEPAADKETIK